MNEDPKKPVRCSFCGKRETEVRRMLQGPGARICDQCVALCMSLLEEELGASGGAGRMWFRRFLMISSRRRWMAMSVTWPLVPAEGWWIMISALGRARRLPLAPEDSRRGAQGGRTRRRAQA